MNETLSALAWLVPVFFFATLVLFVFGAIGLAPSFREPPKRRHSRAL